MSLQKAVANALSFAHLAGIGRKPARAAAAEEDTKDDDAKAEGGDDEDKPKDDDKDDKAKGTKASGKAVNEDDDDKDDDEDREEKAQAAVKEAKAAGYRQGYEAAQTRAATVFASPASANNIKLAAELVFNSTMSAEQIVGALGVAAQGQRRGGLGDRMASVEMPVVGAEAGQRAEPGNKQQAAEITVKAILAASAKARGEKA